MISQHRDTHFLFCQSISNKFQEQVIPEKVLFANLSQNKFPERAFSFLSTGVRKSRLMSQYPEPSPSYIYPGKIPQRFHREI